MKQHLLLGLALLTAAGCSKSSAKPATKETKTDVIVKQTPEDKCDDACTAIAVCTERLNPDEHFRGGLACAENCMAMSPATRDAWVEDALAAERKNDCKRLIDAAPDFAVEEEEGAMFDPALATLPEGELKLGCFAWSERLRAVACVTGDDSNDGV